MTKHALLSPSSAHRWMACPGSISFAAEEPPRSEAAARGALLHEWVAWNLCPEGAAPRPLPNPEEQDLIEVCADYGWRLKKGSTAHWVEQPVPIADFTGEEGATGTVDLLVYRRRERVVDVVDWKFGSGVRVDAGTSANPNPQLALYALGARAFLRHRRAADPKAYRLHVVQPAREGADIVELTLSDLNAFAERVRAAAQATSANPGRFVPGASMRPRFFTAENAASGLPLRGPHPLQ